MARIPTPAQRGQAVGSVQSQFTPTPFQNLNPDADVFGAGQARALGQAAKGLGSLSSDVMKEVESDDKLALTKFETEVQSHQITENARIASLVGQEKQDAAAAAPTAFKAFVEGARAKHSFQLPDNTAAADNFSTLSQSRFSANAVVAFTSGKAVVDKLASVARLGTATRTLVANPDEKGVKVFTGVVRTTVLDPDIGLARQQGLNPDLINYSGSDSKKLAQKRQLENMIVEQEGAAVGQVVNRLLADGKTPEAIAFLEDNPNLGANTVNRTAAETQVAPLRGRVEARAQLTGIVRGLPTEDGKEPTLSAVRAAVYAAYPDDPRKQQDLNQEFTAYSGNRTQARTDLVSRQGSLYVDMIMANKNPMAPENAAQLSEFYAKYPRLLLPGNVKKVSESQAEEEADNKWVTVEKGARVSSDGVEEALAGLAITNPDQFVAAMQSGKFKQFLDRADYADLKLKQDRVEIRIAELADKNPVTVSSVLNRIGVPTSQKAGLNKYTETMKAAIKDVQQRAAEQGRAANMEDIEKAVSGVLIRVSTDGRGWLEDTWTVRGALEVADTEDDFDEYTAKLNGGRKNRRFLAVVFDSTEQRIKQAFDNIDGDVNLTTLAAELGVEALPDARAKLKERDDSYADAADAGIPASFLDFLSDQYRRVDPEAKTAAVLAAYDKLPSKDKAKYIAQWGRE